MTTSITKRLTRRLGLMVIGVAAAGGGACGPGAGVRAGANWMGCVGWAADEGDWWGSRAPCCALDFGGANGSGCAAGGAAGAESSCAGSRPAAGLGWVTLSQLPAVNSFLRLAFM